MENNVKDSSLFDLINKVFNKTIGSELASVKPMTDEEYAEWCKEYTKKEEVWRDEERKLNEYLGDKHEPFEIDRLMDDDITILKEGKFLDDNNEPDVQYDYFFSNDYILNIKSDEQSWIYLAGRHWIYDMRKKKVEILRFS